MNEDIKLYEKELITAGYRQDIDKIRELLKKGVNVNAATNDDDPILITATNDGRWDIMRLVVLEYNADINVRGLYGRTALMSASWEGDVNAVHFLLEHGADIEAKNDNGLTALCLALKGKCKKDKHTVQILKNYSLRKQNAQLLLAVINKSCEINLLLQGLNQSRYLEKISDEVKGKLYDIQKLIVDLERI